MTTSYHMALDIKGAIRNKSFKGFNDDKGNPLSPKMAEAHLRILEYNGQKLLPIGECNNWSDEKGCLGHKKEDL